MTTKLTIKSLYTTIIILILICGYQLSQLKQQSALKVNELGYQSEGPTSIYLYNLIDSYSEEYKIPKYILFNVAYLETGYKGPFHTNYNPSQKSYAGAVGPMQIITKYSHKHAGRHVKENELRNNLELNVQISCKMLSTLYNTYGRWDLALGYYNTGHPQVNDYARYAFSNKDYTNKWIRPKTLITTTSLYD